MSFSHSTPDDDSNGTALSTQSQFFSQNLHILPKNNLTSYNTRQNSCSTSNKFNNSSSKPTKHKYNDIQYTNQSLPNTSKPTYTSMVSNTQATNSYSSVISNSYLEKDEDHFFFPSKTQTKYSKFAPKTTNRTLYTTIYDPVHNKFNSISSIIKTPDWDYYDSPDFLTFDEKVKKNIAIDPDFYEEEDNDEGDNYHPNDLRKDSSFFLYKQPNTNVTLSRSYVHLSCDTFDRNNSQYFNSKIQNPQKIHSMELQIQKVKSSIKHARKEYSLNDHSSESEEESSTNSTLQFYGYDSHPLPERLNKFRWPTEDDTQLCNLVKSHGLNLELIEKCMPKYSKKEIEHHFLFLVNQQFICCGDDEEEEDVDSSRESYDFNKPSQKQSQHRHQQSDAFQQSQLLQEKSD